MDNPVIGFALTGSFCTFKRVLDEMERLKEKYPNIVPIFSHNSRHTDNRFGLAEEFCHRAEEICGRKCLSTLTEVEPIGPKHLLDALIVAPCTGNTLAKLSAGIADTPVTLAVKAHLRNQAPVILAVSTNDGLAANAQNIGKLLARKHHYFVPFGQDDPEGKPSSLVADFSRLGDTLDLALQGKQIQPLLL